MSISEPVEKLMKLFSRFPGVGDKTARRFALFLLQQPGEFSDELASTISLVRENTFPCSICGNLTTEDPCPVCSDPFRDRGILCVLENVEDMISIEQAGVFSGLYFILGGRVSPMDGEDLAPERIAKLREYATGGGFREIIIATNPSVEGDLTFYAVLDSLKTTGLRITRLAFGLPLGGTIGYADRVTLHASIESRVDVRVPDRNGERKE
ncbi:MAG: Recombination protein RecR [Synergistales bacterium 58_81]|nr:MAG: Recombination protein RecR [Synergistales bacterium 57_84]KUK88815.1 MAG: Recombination protein RecR [Synergistales bacterium 58_81]